jgi:predicted thioredoxin/glutaredoxin
VRIELVTRAGCHLCDEALRTLESLGVEPVLRDVDTDEQLFQLYDWRVPVVLVDGTAIAEGKIDGDRLRRALAQ